MIKAALRRAPRIVFAAAVLSGLGWVGTTAAAFTGETQNQQSAFADGWLGQPGSVTATPSGYDVVVGWTPASHGLDGQVVRGEARGTTSNCTGATYATSLTGALPTSQNSWTDVNRGDGAHGVANGDWACYEVVSVLSGTSWETPGTAPAIQVGLAANQVRIANDDGNFDAADTVTITFNQRVRLPGTARDAHICVFERNDIILLGDQTFNCSGTGDAYAIARLSGAGISGNSTISGTGTVTASSSAPWTIVFRVGVSSSATHTGTSTLTPSTSIKSFALTDQATVCTVGANCLPTTTTGF